MLSHPLLRAGHPSRAAAVSVELFGGTAGEGGEHLAVPDSDADPIITEEWQNRFVRNHVRQLAEQA